MLTDQEPTEQERPDVAPAARAPGAIIAGRPRPGRFQPILGRVPTPAAAPVDLFTADQLTVYGADWCGDCRRTKRYLDATNTPYTWVDRDADPALQQRLADAGYLAIPVVVVPGGRILVEPSNAELAEALGVTA